jgi:nucleoside-diphosphate-sugar epimerase
MKTIITGAAGFIGHKIASILLAAGHEVIGIDNLDDYYNPAIKQERIDSLKDYNNFTFHFDDIRYYNNIEKWFAGVDVVYHLAAMAGVAYSFTNPQKYFDVNVLGTLNVLEAMRKNNVGKIVIASTSSVYAGNKIPYVETMAVDKPISPYAASKRSAELLAYNYYCNFGIDVSILRYFTVYGPCGRPDMSINRIITNILKGRPIEIYGYGTQTRDFTYVSDIARGTIAARKKLGYEIINLGGGNEPVSINHVIRKVEVLTGRRAKINYTAGRIGDVAETRADIEKAKMLLDWMPVIKFDDGLLSTVMVHKMREKGVQ